MQGGKGEGGGRSRGRLGPPPLSLLPSPSLGDDCPAAALITVDSDGPYPLYFMRTE